MAEQNNLSELGGLVRKADPDRFFATLFAPATYRETLFLLYAFNHELARARAAADEAMVARIRLQWWREVVQGARRSHPVATPLHTALHDGMLDQALLERMISAREVETDPGIATEAEWRAYVAGSAGALAQAAAQALGADARQAERIAALGTAYGAAGVLRNTAVLAARHRCLLPEETLSAHGLSAAAVVADPNDPRLRGVFARLAGWAREMLARGTGHVPRPLIAAALPGVLARRDLRQPGVPRWPRGFGDRAAVTWAALRGVV